MTTKILSIFPRRVNFRTQTNADWLDGLLVWEAASGGVVVGSTNAGNGTIEVQSIAPGMDLGTHLITVTSTTSLPHLTVTDPKGIVTAEGVIGVSIYADGLTFKITPGDTHFAIGDTFAVSILPEPVDLTGIDFDLQVRLTQTTANVSLSATSHPADKEEVPTIVVGGSGGQVAMRVLKSALARQKFPPGSYYYDILASADGLTVLTFYGTLTHVDGVTFIP